jgi:heme-degrading monooxygenase HmoA
MRGSTTTDGGAAVAETYTNGMWQVKPGEEDDFVAAWRDFVSWASTWPGHGTFRLVRDVDDPSRYMSFAPWESFDAQAAWKANPEFPERIGRVKAHTDDFTPSVFELVTVVE